MVKHHAGYVLMVLPEVLRNPVAFFNVNKDEKTVTKLMEMLRKLTVRPQFHPRNIRRRWSRKKTPIHKKIKQAKEPRPVSLNVKARPGLPAQRKKDASNRIIKRSALCTKYNFDILGIFYRVILNF